MLLRDGNATFRPWLRNGWILLLSAVIVGSPMGCSSRKEDKATEKVVVKDFGTLLVGSDRDEITHTFTIPNPSHTESMSLRLVRKSCSCLAATSEIGPIAPGEDGHISVTVAPHIYPGPRMWLTQYETNLPVMSYVFLRIVSNVVPRLHADQGDLGEVEVPPGEGLTKYFTVVSNSEIGKPATVHLVSSSENLSVVADKVSDSTDGAIKTATLRYKATIRCPKDIYLKYTGVPFREIVSLRQEQGDALEVGLKWRPMAYVRSDCPFLFFNASNGRSSEENISLSSDRSFALTSASCRNNAIHVDFSRDADAKSHKVKCRVEPGHAKTGSEASKQDSELAARGVIIIQTTHPKQPQVCIPYFVLEGGTP